MGQPFSHPRRLYWLIAALFVLAAASVLGQWALG